MFSNTVSKQSSALLAFSFSRKEPLRKAKETPHACSSSRTRRRPSSPRPDDPSRTDASACGKSTNGCGSSSPSFSPRSLGPRMGVVGEGSKINDFSANFCKFWRARSRLYQNEILQENMRSTAFFKLYKICILLHLWNPIENHEKRFRQASSGQDTQCILLHRCNLKNFAKNRFEKTAIFVKFQQQIANVAKFAKFCQISKISAR